MAFLTDIQLGDLGLPEDVGEARAVLVDAEALYDLVQENAWIQRAALDRWAEENLGGPDRLNAAIVVLERAGRLVEIPKPRGTT
jgi:hypothetical protein